MTAGDVTPAGGAGPAPTPSQTVGPFLSIGLAPMERRQLVPDGTPGAVAIGGRVLDGRGDPVPDAAVEIWQPGAPGAQGFGRCLTDAAGRYGFVTTVPGPVALRSGALQAPHLDVLIFARGLTRWLRTRVYFPGEPANGTDPVLTAVPADRRATLVAVPVPEVPDAGAGDAGAGDATPGAAPGGGASRRELRFDVRLQGDGETVFFAG